MLGSSQREEGSLVFRHRGWIAGRKIGPLAVLAWVAGLLALAAPAPAAFPGANGRIAFTSYSGPTASIETIEPDGTGRTELIRGGAGPAWSADGARIAFTVDGHTHTMNADGSGDFEIPGFYYSDLYPSWSPDGKRIAFPFSFCGMGTCGAGIYSMNVDGSDRTAVTSGADPAWSPDGSRIAFERWQYYNTNEGIHTVNPDGTGMIEITGNDDRQPAWSPDGSKIAFVRYSPSNHFAEAEIYSINSDGTEETRLTNNFVSDTQPAWSPDGSKIAFTSYRDGNSDVYIMNADGAGLDRLTRSSAIESDPDWQPLSNQAPDCTGVTATPNLLRPANGRFRNVSLGGATDPDGDAVTVKVDAVTQDEPLRQRIDDEGAPTVRPDAKLGSTPDTVLLRARRDNSGDGRVYRIAFTVSDGKDTCSGVATVDVRRKKKQPAVDSAPPSYNSFGN
jgi:hypothetical protein